MVILINSYIRCEHQETIKEKKIPARVIQEEKRKKKNFNDFEKRIVVLKPNLSEKT